MKFKKCLSILVSAVIMVSAFTLPASADVEKVAGGAQWSHDVGTDLGGRWVYSNVFSSFYWHSSSCTLSGRSDASGRTKKGLTSYSRVANGYIWDTGYAYYHVEV